MREKLWVIGAVGLVFLGCHSDKSSPLSSGSSPSTSEPARQDPATPPATASEAGKKASTAIRANEVPANEVPADELPADTPAVPAATPVPAPKGTPDDSSPATAVAAASGASPAGPGESAVGTAESKPPEPAAKNETRHRILLLPAAGPLVIDVVLRFEKSDFDSALQRLIDEAFRTADADGDGTATWEEVAENPKFQSGEFSNLVAGTEEERRQLIRIYDMDKDGQVDREELPRFITRNAGSGRSFSLRSSNEFRGTNRRRSPTRLLIDADHDGSITPSEMEQAVARLRQRDADDDDVVLLAEIKNRADEMMAGQAAMSNRRRASEPDTAVWLTDPGVETSKRWGMIQFQLQELYSYGEPISQGDWPATPELFRAVDANADGQLTRTELPRLRDAESHLELEITFDLRDEKNPGPRLKPRRIGSALAAMKPTIREYHSRISMRLPFVELEFFVNEDAVLTNAGQAVDAQFMALDRNSDGYLEKDEIPETIPGIAAGFASLDADSNGKVYKEELAAYVEQRSAVTRAQVRARAADQEDALFTALDRDGDGQLNAREIRLTPQKLKEMDVDADGVLQTHEISGSMVLAFVRGNPQQDDQLFAYPAAAMAAEDAATPRWFRGMDGNQDGEVSIREFFGSREQFDQLDVDRDGYLSRDESSAAAEKKSPPAAGGP